MKRKVLFCKLILFLVIAGSLPALAVKAEPAVQDSPVAQASVNETENSIKELTQNGTIEAIIGTDDQNRVVDTTVDPYRKVVHLSMRFPGGVYVGSGVMIGPDTILTAAHNLYDDDTQSWASSVTAVPAMDEGAEKYGIFSASDYWIFKPYKENGNSAYDIAVLRLEQAVPDEVGSLSVSSAVAVGDRVQVAGYPAVSDSKYGNMYTMFDTISNTEDQFLSYQIDTEAGQSGSPVLNSQNEIVGIHILGSSRANHARRVDAEVIDMIDVAQTNKEVTDNLVHHQVDSIDPVEEKLTYRLYHSGIKRHLYTQDTTEVETLVTRGWRNEGVKFKTDAVGDDVYRLYSPVTKEHLYTTSQEEQAVLVTRGWRFEGVSWYSNGDKPVYRLYHSGLKVHLYTADTYEREVLIGRGWRDEGIAWYTLQ